MPYDTCDTSATSGRLKNTLGNSKSTYLLLHKDNPVAWQEWTPEAIAMAKRLDKPIFLSSGYSACHWCHVLASESYMDEAISAIMNEHFINILVDREERPDVDRIYMEFLQETQGRGGWPLSVFLTPDLVPFFAGTYYPRDRFKTLMQRAHSEWIRDREGWEITGRTFIAKLQKSVSQLVTTPSLQAVLDTNPCLIVWNHLLSTYDPRYGGFSQQGNNATGPKFPSSSMTLEVLTRYSIQSPAPDDEDVRAEAREMGLKTLRAMWYGGIRDWVGHGFARYTADEKWFVPHFEKMLSDQAQLMIVATAFAAISTYETSRGTPVETLESDKKLCQDFAIDIVQYVLTGLQHPGGAYYSSENSNAPPKLGEIKSEGSFYTWTKAEFDEVVGEEDAELVGSYFGIRAEGNVPVGYNQHGSLTKMNVLHRARSIRELGVVFGYPRDHECIIADKIHLALEKLRKRRDESRARPALDDKIITSWNGMLVCLVTSELISEEYPIVKKCVPAAERIIGFLKRNLWNPATRTLTRIWRDGKGADAQADDYSSVIKGLLDLYEATGKEDYALFAYELQVRQNELFWDVDRKGFFVCVEDPTIIIRLKDGLDGAEPSASSVAVHNLARIASLFEDEHEQWYGQAVETYTSVSTELIGCPMAIAYTVAGLMDLQRGYKSFYLVGSTNDETVYGMRNAIETTFFPNKMMVHIDPAAPPRRLAEKNSTVRKIVQAGHLGPELRVCQGRKFKESLNSVGDTRRYLQEQVNIEPRRKR